jgi:PilZ domain
VERDAEATGERSAGESRRHYRNARTLRWPVELATVRAPGELGEGEPQRVRAEALGVSLGGTFVVSDAPPPVDTDLHLWLYPPQVFAGSGRSSRLRVLRLLARVRWINTTSGTLPRGFGVAFRALTAADEIALHSSFSRSAKVI